MVSTYSSCFVRVSHVQSASFCSTKSSSRFQNGNEKPHPNLAHVCCGADTSARPCFPILLPAKLKKHSKGAPREMTGRLTLNETTPPPLVQPLRRKPSLQHHVSKHLAKSNSCTAHFPFTLSTLVSIEISFPLRGVGG
ncbi:unnamed protein product [Ectocarpus sp. 12 AP-2014]